MYCKPNHSKDFQDSRQNISFQQKTSAVCCITYGVDLSSVSYARIMARIMIPFYFILYVHLNFLPSHCTAFRYFHFLISVLIKLAVD